MKILDQQVIDILNHYDLFLEKEVVMRKATPTEEDKAAYIEMIEHLLFKINELPDVVVFETASEETIASTLVSVKEMLSKADKDTIFSTIRKIPPVLHTTALGIAILVAMFRYTVMTNIWNHKNSKGFTGVFKIYGQWILKG